MNLFERIIMEAPEDTGEAPEIDNPQDPPDLDAPDADMPGIEEPAQDDMGGYGDPGMDDAGDYGFGEQEEDTGKKKPELKFGEKISAILNEQLYKKMINLQLAIRGQITSIANNQDVLNIVLGEEKLDEFSVVLTKLRDNVELYSTRYYMKSEYGNNLIFYNKCITLLMAINNLFNNSIKKGLDNV